MSLIQNVVDRFYEIFRMRWIQDFCWDIEICVDLRKCITHCVLVTWHPVITICVRKLSLYVAYGSNYVGQLWWIAGVTVLVVMSVTCSLTAGMIVMPPCIHLRVRTAVLNLILCRSGSQCKSRSTGVIMCSNLLTPVTMRAAAASCITLYNLHPL